MAEGNHYDQQSDAAGPSEIQPSLVDPHETPSDSLFNILAGEDQFENFEDIFHVLSSNVELHPPCPPPLSAPQPLPTNDGHSQVSNWERETQQKINQDNSRRRRPSEAHNLMERRRRTRIQEKLNVLQQLIPNCNKTDRVSTLTDVIDYIKLLKQQVEMMPPTGIPIMPPQAPYMPGAVGQQSMQVPCFPPPLVPMTPVMGMGYGMGVYGTPPTPYPTAFPLSPNFMPPFSLPSTTTVGELGGVQVLPPQQFPFHPATLTSATSMTTTRAHDVGGPSTTTTLVSATAVTTTSSSRVVAETTADMIHQMSGIIQDPTTRGRGLMPIVRPSQIVTPSFQGNQSRWILGDDNEELQKPNK